LNSFLVEKVPNNFFPCNQQPHLKKLKIENLKNIYIFKYK
jgi:hypothetical protein